MVKRAFDLRTLRRLPVDERLRVVGELWDSITDENPDAAMPMTPELAEELDRRLAEHENDPDAVIPWEQVRAELMAALERRSP